MSRHTFFSVACLLVAGLTLGQATSAAGVAYFPYETQQLTAEALSQVNSTYTSLFGFENVNSASATNETRKCKLLPGDASWPSAAVWSTFNTLLGGGLIEGVPAAAACYSDWPQYNKTKCVEIQDVWTDPAWV